MAGNSKRQGAVRKPGSKKGAQVGTGGHRRKGLEGKKPTPKAEDRPYHPAGKRKAAAEREAAKRGPARARGGSTGPKTHEIVAGRNAVVEALRAQIPVTTVYLATGIDSDDRTREILSAAAVRTLPVQEVRKPELDRLTDGASHQGVAVEVPAYSYAEPADLLDLPVKAGRAPLIVALDGITDPRNLGAALRSAGAFGVDGVVVPQRRSASVTAAAWKVSAGAAARVPVARATNLVRALEDYKKAGCFVVGLDGGGTTAIADLELATEPLVLVLGSEGKGLGRLVQETCDLIVSIPIAASTESLNAGTAVGIALYEIAQARRSASA
ncbi:23S rRNA (guanosine(2251)-2'-O)-methyltransferase RlmB [Ruania halotolerans]|uniref:23S rRNA (guanosine(2251)-2'-O)-methyltransferase RlmB n=1 Tax=Ruania halotolerans TaxID=2897773 RepID=UPI001E5F1007|nr:23S rRNA (guanosine(2251)-2'-O)-methyltransferase RlmB [Ruania halotolerans]UFU07193.1 23S rRNA (guanosine(2251)-2'-O)-methyltransferase RlmB [Ruania halotolerans]